MSNESKCQLCCPTALSVSLAIKLEPGFVVEFAGLGVRESVPLYPFYRRKGPTCKAATVTSLADIELSTELAIRDLGSRLKEECWASCFSSAGLSF